MKKIAPAVLLSVFLLPLPARAEIKAGSVEVSPFAGYSFFENLQNLEHDFIFGGRLGYNITSHFGIEGVGKYVRTRVDDESATTQRQGRFLSPIDSVNITSYHLDLLYHVIPEGSFNPFIAAGYGANHYNPEINDKNMSVINFGVGAKIWLANQVALRLDLRDNLIVDDWIHNPEATLGIVFAFGGKSAVAEKPAAKQEVAPIAVAAPADTTPPKVVFTAPVNGATNVAADQSATVAFSEDMDPATITGETFTLKQGKTPLSGKVTTAGSNAIFTPASSLEKGKAYTGTVTTGARDLAGNRLTSNHEWSFTTGPVADTTPPTVIFTSPIDGAKSAPVNKNIDVAFSENMDPATLNPATFVVKQGTTPVDGKVTTAAATATFAPAKKLEKGKEYIAKVTTGASDLAGNKLANEHNWKFTAFSEPKVVGVLVTLQDSHFDFDSAKISENGKTILNSNIAALKAKPDMKLRIAGHTSAAGSEEYNQALSERRAEAVKAYLVKEGGIDANRLSTIGYGEKSPAQHEIDPNDKRSPAALANMRVVIEIIEEQ